MLLHLDEAFHDHVVCCGFGDGEEGTQNILQGMTKEFEAGEGRRTRARGHPPDLEVMLTLPYSTEY